MGELDWWLSAIACIEESVNTSKPINTFPFIQTSKQRSPTLVIPSQQRFHKVQFLQKLSCQKPCWDRARLSSLVNKQVAWQELLPELVWEWQNKLTDRPSALYMPQCLYQPIPSLGLVPAPGHVLWNTHSSASALRETESVSQNTLGKIKGIVQLNHVLHLKKLDNVNSSCVV